MGNNGSYVMSTIPLGVGNIKRDEALADAHLIQCITAACRSQTGGADSRMFVDRIQDRDAIPLANVKHFRAI
jgi:hypothetical protein